MSRRALRLAGISLASAFLALLLTFDYLRTPFGSGVGSAFHFGFSGFVALVFLATGALVWYYACDRLVAAVLWWFCLAMACTFAGQTGSIAGDAVLAELTTATSTATVLAFNLLVCVFPYRLLSEKGWQSPPPEDRGQGRKRTRSSTLLRAYLVTIATLGIGSFLCTVPYFLRTAPNPAWLNHLVDGFFAVALLGLLVITVLSYRRSSSPHERMQLRLYVFGGFAAVVPLLVVNIALPELFGVTLFSSDLSTMTIVLLPVLLGYSILRYQLLVFDTYVRRAVIWLVRITSSVLLGSLIITVSFLFHPPVAQIVFIVAACTVLGLCTWWLVRVLVERVFFPEQAYYRRLLDQPGLLARESFDVAKVSELIASASQRAFEVAEVGVLVFDQRTGRFEAAPALSPGTDTRRHLFSPFLGAHSVALEAYHPIITHLRDSGRPLLWSEVCHPAGGAKILVGNPAQEGGNPLLAPICGAGRRLIGVLVLGERGGERPYAGPDFGIIDLILTQFARILENALTYRQQDRLNALQATLYANMPHAAGKTVAEVASACVLLAVEALLAADVADGQAEIWLGTQAQERTLRRLLYAGTTASSSCTLCALEELGDEAENWSVRFYDGASQPEDLAAMPACLRPVGTRPGFASAWLPLHLTTGAHLGFLLLTCPLPHFFSPEEQSLLALFSAQCAAALQSAYLTQEEGEAYERLREAEHVKDRFLEEASHELRTPLAALAGYIELLSTYHTSLSPDSRQEYIRKAGMACEEFGLRVANIMNSGQQQTRLFLHPVDLVALTAHVLELFGGIIAQEQRQLDSDIPSGLAVLADDVPLQQVLMNLLDNALNYSPPRSPIIVTGEREQGEVILRVHDQGPGVEKQDQQRIFERFVRLDRSINSPRHGTGLGLFVCKQLVEAMGGRISVKSPGLPGQGSTFAFRLKAVQDAG